MARDLGLTERGWRKILKGDVTPLATTADCIQRVAAEHRFLRHRPKPAVDDRRPPNRCAESRMGRGS